MAIPPLHCSFCNRPDRQVRRLIHAPRGLHIRDICVRRCVELIGDQVDMERTAFPRARPVCRPHWGTSGYRWPSVRQGLL